MSCYEEKWLDDKTDTMFRLIPRQDKLHREWLVMSLLCHIMPSLHHMMMCHALQSPLDWSFPVSGCLPGRYHALFIMWSFSIMLYHPLSHPISYFCILTHHRTNFLPMPTLSLCPYWSICSHDPLHLLNDLTNRSHCPSCLCSLLLLYLWVTQLQSFCHSYSFVFKLY